MERLNRNNSQFNVLKDWLNELIELYGHKHLVEHFGDSFYIVYFKVNNDIDFYESEETLKFYDRYLDNLLDLEK